MFSSLKKKPRRIQIVGHDVTVKYRKKVSNFGEFYPDDNLIIVANDEKWKEHLLHELLHAAFFYTGHSERFKENEEESIVRALENAFKTLTFF